LHFARILVLSGGKYRLQALVFDFVIMITFAPLIFSTGQSKGRKKSIARTTMLFVSEFFVRNSRDIWEFGVPSWH